MLVTRTGFHLMDGGRGSVVAEIKPIPHNQHDIEAINAALGCLSLGAPDVKIDEAHDVMVARLAPDVLRGSACEVLGSVGCLDVDATNTAL